METETEIAFDGSACGMAVTCTVAGEGASEGAVNTPVKEIVPHAAPVHPVPVTFQKITRIGFESEGGSNVAAKVAVCPAETDDGPVTAMENELVTVTVAVPVLDGSAELMAVTETPGGDNRICGAV
jgi:hypothetical protein